MPLDHDGSYILTAYRHRFAVVVVEIVLRLDLLFVDSDREIVREIVYLPELPEAYTVAVVRYDHYAAVFRLCELVYVSFVGESRRGDEGIAAVVIEHLILDRAREVGRDLKPLTLYRLFRIDRILALDILAVFVETADLGSTKLIK